jgi:protein FAM32A
MSGRGKLSFKGDKKSKKKSSKSKHKLTDETKAAAKAAPDDEATTKQQSDPEEELTEAEKKALKFKSKQAKREMEQVVKLSHRERVEQFNEKLGSLTELNDIPRVSAAGNG